MIIDGKKIASEIKKGLNQTVLLMEKPPNLSVIYVGENPASVNFIARKKKFAEEIGVKITIHHFKKDILEEELKEKINDCSKESTGTIIQLPLPKHINTEEILNFVPIEKDVDILSSGSEQLYAKGKLQIIPPVAGAIEDICARNNISLSDKNIVVVGEGRLVGKPVIVWLKKQGITPTVIDENTKNPNRYLLRADMVISGVGIPHLIKPASLKDRVIIFDAGTSLKDGKILGDVDPACADKASIFTLTPGGIGPITVAILFKNLLSLGTPSVK